MTYFRTLARIAARITRRPSIIAALLLAIFAFSSARATVYAYRNSGYTYTTAGTRLSADGEVLSPFFDLTAGGVPLYVYNAQVRSVNFPDFTSTFTGTAYSALAINTANHLENLGTASFVQFQLDGCYNTVLINPRPGYPSAGMITSASQVKIISRASGSPAVTVFGAGQSNPQGSFSFPICAQVDANGNYIPQQFTVEINGDWLNSLHIFINPPPNSTNGPPAGATQMTPGIINRASFPTSSQVFYFPHGVYYLTAGQNFGAGSEVYLDDGAIIKYTGSSDATNNSYKPLFSMGGATGTQYPAVIRGWGILDGQAMQSYQANGVASGGGAQPACTLDQQVIAPMCQPPNGTVAGAAPGTGIIALSDMTTSSTRPILVDGVVLRNSDAFTFTLNKNQGTATYPITVNNIKIINFSGDTPNEGNSDGIDVFTDQYVNITNSFVRSMDDLIVLYQNTGSPTTLGLYPTAAINVVGNTLWNEYAHAIYVGPEIYNATNVNQPSNPLAIDDAAFDSNIIIHDTGKAPLMGILNGFGGKVQNVSFSNTKVLQATALWGYDLFPPDASTNPGIVGGSSLCNINMTVAQTTPLIIVGQGGSPLEPHVGPVANIQQVVGLPAGNPYVGNGTNSGTYPRAIQYGPQMSNVVVSGAAVTSSVDGNDYFYQSSDGYGVIGTTTPMPQNVVELTAKIRTSTDPNSIWAYNQSQIPGDMLGPQFVTLACPVSPLLQVAQ